MSGSGRLTAFPTALRRRSAVPPASAVAPAPLRGRAGADAVADRHPRDPRVRREQPDRAGRDGGDGERDHVEEQPFAGARSRQLEDVGHHVDEPQRPRWDAEEEPHVRVLGDVDEQHDELDRPAARLREIEQGADDARQEMTAARKIPNLVRPACASSRPPKYHSRAIVTATQSKRSSNPLANGHVAIRQTSPSRTLLGDQRELGEERLVDRLEAVDQQRHARTVRRTRRRCRTRPGRRGTRDRSGRADPAWRTRSGRPRRHGTGRGPP